MAGASKATAIIIGLGAIGSVTAGLLARAGMAERAGAAERAGIGSIVLIDRDIVEAHNLHRQALYSTADVGRPKAVAAAERVRAMNSRVRAEPRCEDLTFGNIADIMRHERRHGRRIILDCTDNLETRYLIDEFCRKNRLQWVYAAAVQARGSVAAFTPKTCMFRDIFPDKQAVDTCGTAGILSAAAETAASLQVSQALRLLHGEQPLRKLIMFDVHRASFDQLGMPGRINMPGKENEGRKNEGNIRYPYLEGKKGIKPVKLCGEGMYQLAGTKMNLKALKERLTSLKPVDHGAALSFGSVTVFADGRALVKAKDEKTARASYAKIIPS